MLKEISISSDLEYHEVLGKIKRGWQLNLLLPTLSRQNLDPLPRPEPKHHRSGTAPSFLKRQRVLSEQSLLQTHTQAIASHPTLIRHSQTPSRTSPKISHKGFPALQSHHLQLNCKLSGDNAEFQMTSVTNGQLPARY